MGSHSITCHPTQVNSPDLIPARQAGVRFTYPGGMAACWPIGIWLHTKVVYLPADSYSYRMTNTAITVDPNSIYKCLQLLFYANFSQLISYNVPCRRSSWPQLPRPVDDEDLDRVPDIVIAAGVPAVLRGCSSDERLTADPLDHPECFDASTLRPGFTSVSHSDINS